MMARSPTLPAWLMVVLRKDPANVAPFAPGLKGRKVLERSPGYPLEVSRYWVTAGLRKRPRDQSAIWRSLLCGLSSLAR